MSILKLISSDEKLLQEDKVLTADLREIISSLPSFLHCFGFIIKTLNDNSILNFDMNKIRNHLKVEDIALLFINKVSLAMIKCTSLCFGKLFYVESVDEEEPKNKKFINMNFSLERIIYSKEINTLEIVEYIKNEIKNIINQSFLRFKDREIALLIPKALLKVNDMFNQNVNNNKKIYIKFSHSVLLIIEEEEEEKEIKEKITKILLDSVKHDDIEVLNDNKNDDLSSMLFVIREKRKFYFMDGDIVFTCTNNNIEKIFNDVSVEPLSKSVNQISVNN